MGELWLFSDAPFTELKDIQDYPIHPQIILILIDTKIVAA